MAYAHHAPAAVLTLLLIAPLALSQEPTPAVGISEWISIVNIPAIPNAPFSATTMMDNIHTLPDGTNVTTKTMTTIARDSSGRTHNENRYYLRPADKGEGRIRDITIFDPTTRTKTTSLPPTKRQSLCFAHRCSVPVHPNCPPIRSRGSRLLNSRRAERAWLPPLPYDSRRC